MRKSNLIDNEGDKVPCLYYMREIGEGEHVGSYMGGIFDCESNIIEEYQCNRLNADRNKSCIGLHYINDPMYPMYAADYLNDKNKMHMIDALKRSSKRK